MKKYQFYDKFLNIFKILIIEDRTQSMLVSFTS